MVLSKKFYKQDTLKVAQDLLGCFLVRQMGKKKIRGMITETEAYVGEDDLACHASKGRTPRTEIMYGKAGHAYVYMIYGMYYCLNVVTEKKNFPAAVLIRGLNFPQIKNESKANKSECEWVEMEDLVLDGPGKLCRFFKIDRRLNNWDLTRAPKQSLARGFAPGEGLWVEKGIKIKKSQIKKSKRVGVDYAGKCKHYLWRFSLE